jgi:chromosome segregation ATPase
MASERDDASVQSDAESDKGAEAETPVIPVPEEAPEEAEVGSKRGRGTAVTGAQSAVAKAKAQLQKAEAQLEKAKNKTGYRQTAEKRQAAIDQAEAKVRARILAVSDANNKLAAAEAEEKRKLDAEEEKRQRKLVDEDAKRDWTEAGTLPPTAPPSPPPAPLRSTRPGLPTPPSLPPSPASPTARRPPM